METDQTVDTYQILNANDLNRLTLIEKFSHGFVLVIFCMSTFFNYAYIAQLTDTKISTDNIFIELIYIIGILINLINSIVIIGNLCVNYKYINLFKRVAMGHETLLFLVCIPTGILSITCETVQVISNFNRLHSNYENTMSIFSIFSKFLMLVILTYFLIHTNTHCDYGEAWQLNLSNMITIEMTIANLLSRLFTSVGKEQMYQFLDQVNVKILDIFNVNSIGYFLETMYSGLFKFYYRFENISCMVAITLLIVPMMRHYNFVQRHKVKSVSYCDKVHVTMERSVVLLVMMLSAVIIIINIAFMVIYAVSQGEPVQLKILICCMYTIAIINCYYMYLDISKWSFKNNRCLPGSIFLWIGTFGQFLEIIAYIQHAIHGSMIHGVTAIDVTIFLQYTLLTIDCFAQNIVSTHIMERNAQRLRHSYMVDVISCPLFLFIINLLYFIRTVYILHVKLDSFPKNYLFVTLFESGFLLIGGVFATIHRAYAAIILIDYIKLYFKSNPYQQSSNNEIS